MSLARRKRRELKRVGKADAGRIVTIINKFIEAKYLIVDASNYHVTMLEEMWDLYEVKISAGNVDRRTMC